MTMSKKEFMETDEPLSLICSLDPTTGEVLYDTYPWDESQGWLETFKKDFPKMVHFICTNPAGINARRASFGMSPNPIPPEEPKLFCTDKTDVVYLVCTETPEKAQELLTREFPDMPLSDIAFTEICQVTGWTDANFTEPTTLTAQQFGDHYGINVLVSKPKPKQNDSKDHCDHIDDVGTQCDVDEE